MAKTLHGKDKNGVSDWVNYLNHKSRLLDLALFAAFCFRARQNQPKSSLAQHHITVVSALNLV